MRLEEVSDKKTKRDFIRLPLSIYPKDSAWIRPLDADIEAVFDPDKNKTFRHGECIRWVLYDTQEKPLGRVAAFINKKTINKDNDQPTGGMGFFESINDREAAFKLFDACKDWLQAKGMEAMDGPINFGERDKWWGLLVQGYEKEPNYNCNYNLPYYQDLFEAYGFQVYFKQFTFGRITRAPFSDKLEAKAARLFKNEKYHFEHLKLNNLEKYTEDFRTVYNAAWAKHGGFAAISSLQAKALMKQIKPIIDEKIIYFGYYENEPIAVFIILPEFNQIVKHVNGKMDLLGKLKFLYIKWRKLNKRMFGLVFGVAPSHQGKGVEAALVKATGYMVQDDYHRYETIEMNWVGDFNPKMIHTIEQVGGDVYKTHHTYRKLFDESKPFKRSKIIS